MTISLDPITELPEKSDSGQLFLHIGGIITYKPLDFYYEVYLNIPAGEVPDFENFRPYYLGNIAIFSSGSQSHHHGDGINFNYEISEVIQALKDRGAWTGDMWLTLEPRKPGVTYEETEKAVEKFLSFTDMAIIHTSAD